MNRLWVSIGVLSMVGVVGCAAGDEAQAGTAGLEQDRELLIFSKTTGFRHESIEAAVPAITALAQEHEASAYATEDASFFTDANLERFDVVIFVNTTGPVLDDTQQGAFERYIQNGGGYVGIHAASDIFAGDEPIEEWEWYNHLVGAVFASHPSQQEASLIVVDRNHPATRMLDERWVKFDEWYNFRELPEDVNVLLRVDTDSYEGSEHPGDHPIAWYHEYDGGRAFYTGLGHTTESFTEEPVFLEHLWGGIEYAMGESY